MKKTYFICLLLSLVLLAMPISVAEETGEGEAVTDEGAASLTFDATGDDAGSPDDTQTTPADVTDMGGTEPQVSYVNNPNATDRLNLRQDPSTTADVIGRFYTGTVVEVLGVPAEYTQVKVGDLVGYMQSSFLSDTRVDLPSTPWAIVSIPKADERLHLRANTEEGALSYGLFSNGTTLQILEDAGTHYKVRTTGEDGANLEGYMLKDYLQVDATTDKPVMTELTEGLIDASSTTLYAFPSRYAISLGVHWQGETVRVLGISGVWYYVEVSGPNGWASESQRGFMLSQDILVGNSGGIGAGSQTFAVVKNADEKDRIALRASATWSSESLGLYANTAQMILLDEGVSLEGPKPTWVHVMMGDKEGYVQGEFIEWVMSTPVDTW